LAASFNSSIDLSNGMWGMMAVCVQGCMLMFAMSSEDKLLAPCVLDNSSTMEQTEPAKKLQKVQVPIARGGACAEAAELALALL
jgi:hypothetical protein